MRNSNSNYYRSGTFVVSAIFALILIWECNPVWGQDYSMQILEGHGETVTSVAFSPDGKTLASGSNDTTIKLWDTQAGKLKGTLRGRGGIVYSVAFSPDGKTLAVGSHDEMIELWDPQLGNLKRSIKKKHLSMVLSLAFSPDGRVLASGCNKTGKKIRFWDPQTGNLIRAIERERESDDVNSIAFSPDGWTLATGSSDVGTDLWDLRTGRLKATLNAHGILGASDGTVFIPGSSDRTVYSVAYSADGKTLASAGRHKTIDLWNPQTGKLQRTLTGHDSIINCVAISPDGKTLASCGNSTVKLWDVQTGQLKGTPLKEVNAYVKSLAFSPNGKILAANFDNTIRLIDVGSIASPRLSKPTIPEHVVKWPKKDGGNGHFYAAVKSHPGIVWEQANDAANAVGGYLVTITSLAESEFVFQLIDKPDYWNGDARLNGPWIGAVQKPGAREPDSGWIWLTGEPFRYANWDSSQPNEWKGLNENRIHFGNSSTERVNAWSDVSDVKPDISAYIIEFEAEPGRILDPIAPDSAAHGKTSVSLEDTWKVVSSERNGKDVPNHAVTRYIFKDGQMTVQTEEQPSADFQYVVNPEMTPCHLDLTLQTPGGKQLAPMIYRIQNGDLIICYAAPGDARPEKFTSAENRTLILLRREPAVKRSKVPMSQPPVASEKSQQSVPLEIQNSSSLYAQLNSGRILVQDDSFTIGCIAYSPDGKTLASGHSDKSVKLWDVGTGNLIVTLKDNRERVTCIAFSPDGTTLATGGQDKTIKLWDPQTGIVTRTLVGHRSFVQTIAFSSDGKTLASCGNDQTIRLWDPQTGIQKREIEFPSYPTPLAFSPDGRMLAVHGKGASRSTGDIKLLSPQSGNLVGTLEGLAKRRNRTMDSQDELRLLGHKGEVLSLTFSPDGRTLASGSQDTMIKIWDPRTGRMKQSLIGHKYDVYTVAFSENGKLLASGGRGEAIRLWDPETGQLQQILTGHTGNVYDLVFSPDGRTLVSHGNHTIRIWDIATLEFFAAPLPPSIAGKWDVSAGPLKLTVQQNKVTGSYALFNGQLEGQLSDDLRTIRGTWRQSNGRSGGFNLRLSFDGKQIKGRRWIGKKSDVGFGDAWSGKRIGEVVFSEVPRSESNGSNIGN